MQPGRQVLDSELLPELPGTLITGARPVGGLYDDIPIGLLRYPDGSETKVAIKHLRYTDWNLERFEMVCFTRARPYFFMLLISHVTENQTRSGYMEISRSSEHSAVHWISDGGRNALARDTVAQARQPHKVHHQ